MERISRTTPAVYLGRGLAYDLRNKSAAQRAVIAAEDGDGPLCIYQPTKAQRATLYRVSIPTLNAARALAPADRDGVKRGLRPLVEPKDRLKAAVRAVATDDDVVRLLIELGPNRVYRALDKITSPMRDAAE